MKNDEIFIDISRTIFIFNYMVKYPTQPLDTTFGALADPIRRAILERLAEGEARVTDLAEPFEVSLPAISKHLRVLENSGLLVRKKYGKAQYCQANTARMQDAEKWLARYRHYWENSSDTSAPDTSNAEPPVKSSQNTTRKREREIFPLTNISRSIIFNRQVNFDTNQLDAIFSALSDPTRRAMLACLAFGDAPVTELAAPFNISLPAFSKHLRVLEQTGLVAREKRGRVNLCRLVATPMKDAAGWIGYYRQFWEKHSSRLNFIIAKVQPSLS
jgi:DNA-binding transcriptional ArsR family regulator